MDDVESVEPIEESLEEWGPKAIVKVFIKFKSGTEKNIEFNVPAWSPIYAEPLTAGSMYSIISSSYSFGEAPFLSFPDGQSKQFFVDLGSTDYLTIEVEELE